MKTSKSERRLIFVLLIIVLEIVVVLFFVPTISIQTPQEEKYLLPWEYTLPKMPDSSVTIDLEVHNLVFPEKATPNVNDVIVYSFNITNLTNETIEISHTCNVISPIFESIENRTILLESGRTENIKRMKVVLKNEGVNEIDVVFNLTNKNEKYLMEHYVWAISQQTENTLLFNKYGQILTLIVLIPSTIIALKNLWEFVTVSKEDSP